MSPNSLNQSRGSQPAPSSEVDITSTPCLLCVRCGELLTSVVFCERCGAILAPTEDGNDFQFFGISRRYDLDTVRLRSAYREITRNIHPDRFSDRDEEERSLATRWSARINRAFVRLMDPVQRADYLLELAGGPSALDVREVRSDLLSQVLMIREDIGLAHDTGESSVLHSHRAAVQMQREATVRSIAERATGLNSAGPEDRKELRRLLNSIKYLDNLLNELAADPLATQEEGLDD